ncbi:MAG: hypothetical protein II062_03405 [Oscillospiraceae bacterium]|nr:hypothetical protein [Oscillospiraceae bacterium]MBR7010186.1 hypothetical protein [Oscillospiraceae bacterium]
MEPEALNERPVPEGNAAEAVPAPQSEAPILINHYHLDEDSLRKSYKELTRNFVLIQLVISVALLGLAIFYTVRYAKFFSESKQLIFMVLLLYVLAGFEIWQALNSVNKAVKRTMKRIEETQHVREYDVTLRFGEKEIVVDNSFNADSGRLLYSHIKKLKRCEDLIIIRTLARRAFTLDPTRFDNGTEADFWRLMCEKCPDAVPADRKTAI